MIELNLKLKNSEEPIEKEVKAVKILDKFLHVQMSDTQALFVHLDEIESFHIKENDTKTEEPTKDPLP